MPVALLAEGVDRNYNAKAVEVSTPVALLAEGVDRNKYGRKCCNGVRCRPPRGGRG